MELFNQMILGFEHLNFAAKKKPQKFSKLKLLPRETQIISNIYVHLSAGE
jgi:hypothetical protein